MTAKSSKPTKSLDNDRISSARLRDMANRFVEGTDEGNEILRSIYPEHFYDKQRLKMGMELAGKEIAKIVDVDKPRELEHMQSAVADLYEGRQGVYTPIHDFWSFVEMVLHVKKKELPELITAANITWTEEELELDELELTWMPFLQDNTQVFGPKPWKVSKVRQLFTDDDKLLDQAKREQMKTVGKKPHNFDQSEEPITLLHRNDKLELIDGNGRLYRTLLQGDKKIDGYVGRLHGPMPTNYWVSAGSLKQFCLEIRGYHELNHASFEDGLSYLRIKLRNNTSALINYVLFLRDDFPELEAGLKDLLPPRPVN